MKPRQLTHYELSILIKNEITKMYDVMIHNFNPKQARARAEDIIKYCEEYDSLGS